jgi:hypothetical protein
MDASSKNATEQAPTTNPQGYLIHARNGPYVMPYHLEGLEGALALLARDIIPRVLRLKQERQKKRSRAMVVYEPDRVDWARYAFNCLRLLRDDLVKAGVDVQATQNALLHFPFHETEQDVGVLENAYRAVFLLRENTATANEKPDNRYPPCAAGFSDVAHADLWGAVLAQQGKSFKKGALTAKLPKGVNYSDTHIKNWLHAMCADGYLRHTGQTYCPILPGSGRS